MCGIAGIARSDGGPVDIRLVRRMTARLAHRGPDGDGFFEDTGPGVSIALGHRRLSITDLSPAGHQPMSTPDGRWTIVFNGAIYNAPELRHDLIRAGESFRSSTDTEVLLRLLAREGPRGLDRCNGMWAFALWDSLERKLVCARDRFGIKPFVYAWDGRSFAFGSEPKALRPAVPAEANRPLIPLFLRTGAVAGGGEATAYSSCKNLPEGSLLEISERGLVVRPWYDIEQASSRIETPPTFEKAAERLRELLTDSVRIRLRSDVPIGVFVSGGIDSSSIALLAAEEPHSSAFSRRAISLRYPGRPEIDETRYSDVVTAAAGLATEYVEPSVDEMEEEFEEFVTRLDDLVMLSSQYAQHRLYQKAREMNLPVMLSGQGSDEQFGGYEPWDVYVRQLWREGKTIDFLHEAWTSAHRRFRLPRAAAWFALRLFEAVRPGRSGVRRRSLETHLLQQVKNEYLPAILRWEDRSSMAFGVEARVPFLDYRIVELAVGLPARFRLSHGVTKTVLRAAMADRLPGVIATRRRKLGLPGPSDGFGRLRHAPIDVAWQRLRRAGWVEGKLPKSMDRVFGLRVRVLDAWTRRCLGPDPETAPL